MTQDLLQKYQQLLDYLRKTGRIAIAFSGGVDSTFLLKAASEALPADHILALTINSLYIPRREIEETGKTAGAMHIRHVIVNSNIPAQIMNNPKERCYICKTFIFSMLKEVAKQHGFEELIEGTNADDTLSHRPGLLALTELGIRSPLKECLMTKQDIRTLSRDIHLDTWDKPSNACLLTRIPYNTPVDSSILLRIEKSEQFLSDLGLRNTRVRAHGDLARIEADTTSFTRIISGGLYEKINKQLKRYGFKFVTLDLEGIRSGSFDN